MKHFIILGLLCCFFQAVFLSHYWVVGNGVWGDGRYYYAILRSAVIDHDLDFHNESKVDPFAFEQIETVTGKLFNKYSVGTPILWAPFFVMAHVLTWGDGYGHLYRLFIGVGAVTYGWLGLCLIYFGIKKILSGENSAQIALLSTALIALGSNAFFYLAVDPVNSHSVSIFAAGLFFYMAISFWQKPRWQTTLLLGLTCGLLALIRMQDSIFFVGVLWLISHQNKLSWRQKVCHLGLSAVAASLVFLPQLAEWQYLYGAIRNPYSLVGESFYPLQPHLLEVLFSPNNGLFLWSPLLLLSLWGLVISRRHILSQLGLLLWAAETYAIASWHGWWGGASFGGRMFLTLVPFFIWGVAQAMMRIRWNSANSMAFLMTVTILNFGAIGWFLLAN